MRTALAQAPAFIRLRGSRSERMQPFVTEAAMAKLYASEVAERVASQAINWAGGVGFTRGARARPRALEGGHTEDWVQTIRWRSSTETPRLARSMRLQLAAPRDPRPRTERALRRARPTCSWRRLRS